MQLPGKLGFKVAQDGANLSSGQRQLVWRSSGFAVLPTLAHMPKPACLIQDLMLPLPSLPDARQLCIARALLSNCALVVCDEATSSVDPGTDARIQTIVRDKFQGRTVITIAHRLQTVRQWEWGGFV